VAQIAPFGAASMVMDMACHKIPSGGDARADPNAVTRRAKPREALRTRWGQKEPGGHRITKITTGIITEHPPGATRSQQCVTTAYGSQLSGIAASPAPRPTRQSQLRRWFQWALGGRC
jgi:hypothetical protein